LQTTLLFCLFHQPRQTQHEVFSLAHPAIALFFISISFTATISIFAITRTDDIGDDSDPVLPSSPIGSSRSLRSSSPLSSSLDVALPVNAALLLVRFTIVTLHNTIAVSIAFNTHHFPPPSAHGLVLKGVTDDVFGDGVIDGFWPFSLFAKIVQGPYCSHH
jgi:hypothetical protein